MHLKKNMVCGLYRYPFISTVSVSSLQGRFSNSPPLKSHLNKAQIVRLDRLESSDSQKVLFVAVTNGENSSLTSRGLNFPQVFCQGICPTGEIDFKLHEFTGFRFLVFFAGLKFLAIFKFFPRVNLDILYGRDLWQGSNGFCPTNLDFHQDNF